MGGQKTRQGVTIMDRESFANSDQQGLIDRINKTHSIGKSVLLVDLMKRGYDYGQANRVLDLAERTVRGIGARIRAPINREDVDDIVKLWYERIRVNRDFPRSVDQFSELFAKDFAFRIHFHGPVRNRS